MLGAEVSVGLKWLSWGQTGCEPYWGQSIHRAENLSRAEVYLGPKWVWGQSGLGVKLAVSSYSCPTLPTVLQWYVPNDKRVANYVRATRPVNRVE